MKGFDFPGAIHDVLAAIKKTPGVQSNGGGGIIDCSVKHRMSTDKLLLCHISTIAYDI